MHIWFPVNYKCTKKSPTNQHEEESSQDLCVHDILKKIPQIISVAGCVHAGCERVIRKQHFTSLGWHLRWGLEYSWVEKIYTSCKGSRALHVRLDSRIMGETSLAHGFVGMWGKAAASAEICLQEAEQICSVVSCAREEGTCWTYSRRTLCSPAGISGLDFWTSLLMDSLVIPHCSRSVTCYTALAACKKRAATAGSHKHQNASGCSSTTRRTEIWRESS